MLAPLFGLNDTFRIFDSFERELERMAQRRTARSPLRSPVGLTDEGSHLLFWAEIPGVADNEVDVTIDRGVLAVKVHHLATAPSGYKLVRSERPSLRFEQRLELPVKVDEGAVTAEIVDGLLTVKLPKAAEAAPRKIPVRAASTEHLS